jgi:hypothetical protein
MIEHRTSASRGKLYISSTQLITSCALRGRGGGASGYPPSHPTTDRLEVRHHQKLEELEKQVEGNLVGGTRDEETHQVGLPEYPSRKTWPKTQRMRSRRRQQRYFRI